MPIHTKELLNLLAEICEEKDIKVCINESLKGALLTFVTTGIGGLLLGPVGLAIGGAVGGGIAAAKAQGRFRPASQVLLNLPDDKKQMLCRRIQLTFKDLGAADLIMLVNMILTQQSLKNIALEEVKRYLTKDLNFTIQ